MSRKILEQFTLQEKTKLAGIEDGAQKNDIDQIRAVWDTTTVVLDGTEQLIAFDTVADSQDITMPSNGIFEVSRDGYYTGSLSLFIDQSTSPNMVVWVECRATDLDPWDLCGGTMFKFNVNVDGGNTYPFDTNFNFSAGQQFRILIKRIDADPNASLDKQTETVSLGTITQYPAAVQIYRAGNKKTT